jgi:hypothetical protein
MDRSFADLESLFQQGISARKFKHTKVERGYHVSPSHRFVSAVLIDFASRPQSSTRWSMPPLWTRRSSSRITSNTLKLEGSPDVHRSRVACYRGWGSGVDGILTGFACYFRGILSGVACRFRKWLRNAWCRLLSMGLRNCK